MPVPLHRIHSIDILRAITMVLMIFVNDLWSLQNIPQWLEHTAAATDGMGLADIVFPAFLVIVGMSIPFSIHNRKNKGEPAKNIFLHIVSRSIALLVMGVFLVNGEYLNAADTGMPTALWNTLSCLSFILIWNSYPPTLNKYFVNGIRITGILILLILAWIFRGGDDGQLRFGTFWWGILGLIGWAYLACATVFLLAGKRFSLIVLFWLITLFLCIGSHAKWIGDESLLRPFLSLFGDGSMPAFVCAGMISSMLLIHFQHKKQSTRLIISLILIASLLIIAGILLRQFWGISKIRATPSWVLICTGITFIGFAAIYWLTDIRKKSHWFRVIKPAGTNTLLCYLLPYFVYALIYGLLNTAYPEVFSTGYIGLFKSFVFALVIVQLTGLLGKAGLHLKL